MTKPEKIPIEKYDYPLPDERIAKYPLADRDASKVLVYWPGKIWPKRVFEDQPPHEQKQSSQEQDLHAPGLIEQKQFSQVPELLEKGDQLYFNATRVVQARLIFRKSTGARIEIFCLEPFLPADYQLAFSSTDPVEFVCLIGNSKKWKEGALTKKLGQHKISGERKSTEEIATSGDRMDKGDGVLGASDNGADRGTGAPDASDNGADRGTGSPGTSDNEADTEIVELLLTAEISGRQDDKFIVRFSWNDPGTSFGEILERSGSTPIPPYLNREAEDQDAATYQTVYARQDGSVAAPTAGLHFTDRVLEALDQKGVQRHELILHVGAGTFIPVKEENAVDHQMHAELVTADRPLLESLLSGDRKIAVGTTTTRSLESIYWLGVKAISNTHFTFENLCLDQWDAYTMEDEVPLEKALKALLKKMDDAGMESFSFHTRLMITPGYRFRVIGGLFTNFHQPKSTLLLLIAAVAGDDWRKIYDFALKNEFRFLSYGDSSLLFLQQAD
jgi:S-adenosylmethionine:tRNA ribosyltransferase-isomerase